MADVPVPVDGEEKHRVGNKGLLMTTFFKERTPRNKHYLDFIKRRKCLVCIESFPNVIAHHENEIGHGAKGQKTSDYRALPLCGWHHQIRHQQGRSMWLKWGISPEKEITRLNEEWQKLKDL